MARLPYIEPEQADPVTKQVYDDAEARFEMGDCLYCVGP